MTIRAQIGNYFFHAFNSVGQVAQSVEQRTENPCVGGSIPSLATIFVRHFRLDVDDDESVN